MSSSTFTGSQSSSSISHSLQDSYVPERDENGLIKPSEYQKTVVGKVIPNTMRLTVTEWDHAQKKPLSRSESAIRLLHANKFALCFQPGASTAKEGECELYSKKNGAPGCTGEVIALDDVFYDMRALGYEKIFVCSTKTPEQQRQVFLDRADKLTNKNIRFISDPEGRLAKLLGLPITEDTVTHKQTQEPHSIRFIERIQLFGETLKITDFICAAQMKDPLQKTAGENNARALPAYIRAKQQQQQQVVPAIVLQQQAVPAINLDPSHVSSKPSLK